MINAAMIAKMNYEDTHNTIVLDFKWQHWDQRPTQHTMNRPCSSETTMPEQTQTNTKVLVMSKIILVARPGILYNLISAIYQDRCPCLRHYNYNRYACGQIKTIYKCSLVFLYVCFIVLIMSVMKLQFHHAMKRVRRNMDFVMYDDSMVACFCPSINYINVYHDYVVTLLTCIYVIMHNNW